MPKNYYDKLAEIKCLDELIEKNSKNTDVLIYRAKLKIGICDFEGALDDVNRALKIDCSCSYAYAMRANVHGWMLKFKESIDDANEALRLNPNNISALQSRAEAGGSLKKYQEAIDDANEVVTLDSSKKSWAYCIKADVKFLLKEYKEAIMYASESININDTCGRAYGIRALATYQLRTVEGILDDFDKKRLFQDISNAIRFGYTKQDQLLDIEKRLQGPKNPVYCYIPGISRKKSCMRIGQNPDCDPKRGNFMS